MSRLDNTAKRLSRFVWGKGGKVLIWANFLFKSNWCKKGSGVFPDGMPCVGPNKAHVRKGGPVFPSAAGLQACPLNAGLPV